MPDIDFGFGGNQTVNTEPTNKETEEEVVDVNSSKTVDSNTGDEETDITAKDKDDIVDDDTNNKNEKPEDKNKEDETSKDEPLEKGTIVEYNNNKYTVDDNGNLVDKDGKIFKEAKDVNSWISSLESETTEEEADAVVDVKSVQKALGVEITDENGKPIEFENTAEGVASYVHAYVNSVKEEIQNATIDALYNKYPILENVINYYVANGNSLEGFNELKDRSTIQLDVNNEAQCEAIIREAWKEDNRKGDVNSYIQYLKAQNLLGATAEEELSAMVERDKEAADELARKADEEEKRSIAEQKAYWEDINKRIMIDKKIGKYQIPETIIRSKNGQKISATPIDFYNYIYQVDKYGHSQYENELIAEAKENPETRVVDDMIAAYLKFTGGNYESLVNMAINEQKVKTIKLKSNTSRKPKVNVVKPSKSKDKEIDFGF